LTQNTFHYLANENETHLSLCNYNHGLGQSHVGLQRDPALFQPTTRISTDAIFPTIRQWKCAVMATIEHKNIFIGDGRSSFQHHTKEYGMGSKCCLGCDERTV